MKHTHIHPREAPALARGCVGDARLQRRHRRCLGRGQVRQDDARALYTELIEVPVVRLESVWVDVDVDRDGGVSNPTAAANLQVFHPTCFRSRNAVACPKPEAAPVTRAVTWFSIILPVRFGVWCVWWVGLGRGGQSSIVVSSSLSVLGDALARRGTAPRVCLGSDV